MHPSDNSPSGSELSQTSQLLLVDDDDIFCSVLSRALTRRGFSVSIAHSVDEGLAVAENNPPRYAIVDLNMPGASGLTLVEKLKARYEPINIVVLTGYASVATAVEAIKLGATHYLAKPADPDEIVRMLDQEKGDASATIEQRTPSVGRLEWEHIQRVLVANNHNISATARELGMHRRTLQRKLQKRPSGGSATPRD